MSNQLPSHITRLLMAWSGGDPQALAELMPLVCDELRQMARRSLISEKDGHSFQATDLVQEFFLRIQSRRTVSWRNRAHFFGFAGQTIRRILVDHARHQQRKKRGSGESPVSLGPELEGLPARERNLEILALHEVLDRLEAIDERAAEVVKLRFFVGMKVKEAAAALEISPATVKRDWDFARLWLYRELQGLPQPESDRDCESASATIQVATTAGVE